MGEHGRGPEDIRAMLGSAARCVDGLAPREAAGQTSNRSAGPWSPVWVRAACRRGLLCAKGPSAGRHFGRPLHEPQAAVGLGNRKATRPPPNNPPPVLYPPQTIPILSLIHI
eukprot:1662960-Alexandrium_andersonii.AAC.1